MDRLFVFWVKHCPDLSTDSQTFVHSRTQLKTYGKKQVIKPKDMRFPFFCIVLEGLVAGYRKKSGGAVVLTELMWPMDYFTGTQHPFTPRIREAEYIAIEKTVLLLMPIAEARDAQRRYPTFSELVQVMKQRKLDFLEMLLALGAETDGYTRYRAYMARFANQARQLPDMPQWQLLRMGRSTYYRMKKRYLLER